MARRKYNDQCFLPEPRDWLPGEERFIADILFEMSYMGSTLLSRGKPTPAWGFYLDWLTDQGKADRVAFIQKWLPLALKIYHSMNTRRSKRFRVGKKHSIVAEDDAEVFSITAEGFFAPLSIGLYRSYATVACTAANMENIGRLISLVLTHGRETPFSEVERAKEARRTKH